MISTAAMQRQDEVKIIHGRRKREKSHSRYKLHAIVDRDYNLIRRISTTNAPIHDSRTDPSKEVDVVHRDKGYQRPNVNETTQL